MISRVYSQGFHGGLVVKNPPANAGDGLGLIPGSGWSPGEGNGNPHQHSCLRNPMDQRSPMGHSPWGCKWVGHDLVTKQQQYSLPLTHIVCLLFLIYTPTYWFKTQSLSSRLHCGCSSSSPYSLFCPIQTKGCLFSLRRPRKASWHHNDSQRPHIHL